MDFNALWEYYFIACCASIHHSKVLEYRSDNNILSVPLFVSLQETQNTSMYPHPKQFHNEILSRILDKEKLCDDHS